MRWYGVLASLVWCAAIVLPAGAAAPAPDVVLAYTVAVGSGTDAINGDIVVARSDGSQARTLLGGDTSDYEPVWSPKGDRIAFIRRPPCSESGMVCADLPDDLWVVNEDGTGVRPVTGFPLERGNTYAYSPSWSPDGSRIAHCRGTPNDSSLWISRVDRRASRRLPGKSCRQVAWSPDGRRIAVFRELRTELVTPSGRVDRVLPRNGPVAWSPDSSRLAIHTRSGIYVLPIDAPSPSRRILGRGFTVVHWSRAEMILAGGRAVYSRSVATGRVRKLFTLPAAAAYVDWRD